MTRGISQETVSLYCMWVEEFHFRSSFCSIVVATHNHRQLVGVTQYSSNKSDKWGKGKNEPTIQQELSQNRKMKFTTFRENKYNLTIEQMETNICRVDIKKMSTKMMMMMMANRAQQQQIEN